MEFRHVLVTGASSGLGRGLALHYARHGATVHALARREEALRGLAAEAAGAGASGRVVPVPLDVTDLEALASAIEDAHRAAGGALDLVIANAGTGDATFANRMDWRVVRRVLDLNATAACVTLAAALPAMVERRRGTVVAVSSLAATRGLPGAAAYCASKAALHAFVESARIDLAGTGVRAIAVYPGFVRTELVAGSRFPMPFLMECDEAVAEMVDGIARGDEVIAFPLGMVALSWVFRALPRGVYEPLLRVGRGRGWRGARGR